MRPPSPSSSDEDAGAPGIEPELPRRGRALEDANERLRLTIEGLERANEALRARFEERTADLERANEALQTSEEQLRQAQKTEAVGRLAGGVAHDFNNILSVVLSYVELLLDVMPAGDPVRGDLEEVRTAALRGADLTRQLLAFSRHQVVIPVIVDLGGAIAALEKTLRLVIGEGIELEIVTMAGLANVMLDPGHLDQVIMNLALNARDAMTGGGKLTIKTANVELDERYARQHLGAKVGAHVMLAVTDTGSGMDPATQARMFEPFFTTKERGRGTGLGLATVSGIVQQSGGHVRVSSEPGKGTTFEIYFPWMADDRVVRSLSVAPVSTRTRGDETILVVDDDDQVRAAAAEILRRLGYELLEARDTGEALLLVEQHPRPIHLLLTEIVMPRMNGLQLARQAASVRPEIRLLCMSGWTDGPVADPGIHDSAVAFLEKPFTPGVLARKVRGVLDERAVDAMR